MKTLLPLIFLTTIPACLDIPALQSAECELAGELSTVPQLAPESEARLLLEREHRLQCDGDLCWWTSEKDQKQAQFELECEQ